MLKKLIKYDLKWSFKIISVYYIIGIITAIVGRLFDLIPDSTLFDILGKIIKGASISLTITGLINCIIRAWVRMIQNMYKDESYLTHTIPTSIHNHYYSKIISTFIALFTSFLVLVINLAIMYLSKDFIEVLKNLFKTVVDSYDIPIGIFCLIVIILLILQFTFIILCGFFAIIYGYSFESGKLGKSFIVGFIAYGIASNISLIVMLFSTIFSKGIYEIIFMKVQVIDFKVFITIILMSCVLYLIYSFVLFILSNNKLKKGVNIE